MEFSGRLHGVEDALKALQAAFPDNPKKQAQVMHSAMGRAARKTILPLAKQWANDGDGSGALAESLKVRVQPMRNRRAKGTYIGMEVTPVRHTPSAVAMYIAHYYNAKGIAPPANIVSSGILHGHLVEFGFTHKSGQFVAARPFLWPAAEAGKSVYIDAFASMFRRSVEAAVKKAAKS